MSHTSPVSPCAVAAGSKGSRRVNTADLVPTSSRKGGWAVAQYSSAGHLLSAPRSMMLMQRFEGLRGQRSSEQVLLQQQQADEAEGEGGAAEPGAGMVAAEGPPLRKQARAVQLHIAALHCQLSTFTHST